MRFQTDDSLRTDHSIMDGARGEIESVSGLEGQLLSELGEAECNASLHHVDDLVIPVRVRSINVMWTIGP